MRDERRWWRKVDCQGSVFPAELLAIAYLLHVRNAIRFGECRHILRVSTKVHHTFRRLSFVMGDWT